MKHNLVIAIDGPAASGKSTTARRVADVLGYVYVDSGAMYRAATLAVLEDKVAPGDEAGVVACVGRHDIGLRTTARVGTIILLDGRDVTREIRSEAVTSNVSTVSSYRGVRALLVAAQRAMGISGGVVMDGRDIGTTVFPSADLKIFMVAEVVARATRRHMEQSANGLSAASIARIAQQIEERDRLDSTREHSPLTQAPDAIVLDTSRLTIDEQVARVVELATQRMKDER